MSSVSYLITTHNEDVSQLLGIICDNMYSDDEVIILDDYSTNKNTLNALDKYAYMMTNVKVYKHRLDNDYGAHKNFGVSKSRCEYVFQLDGDELPPISLIGDEIKDLLDSNKDIEAFAVPRCNIVQGCKPEHAAMYGWSLEQLHGESVINWSNNYDYQWRIFKRCDHIKYHLRLHEVIQGYQSYTYLPGEEQWALVHRKTIGTQLATNKRYNAEWSEIENRGHN